MAASGVEGESLRWVRTACTRDCPDACAILAATDGERVHALRGDPDHPITRGFLCRRTRRFVRWRQQARDRLRAVQVRRSWWEAVRAGRRPPRDPPPRHEDPFVTAPWEPVLDALARQLEQIRNESGPAAILLYRSGGSLGMLQTLWDALFEAFGPVACKRGDICSGAGEAAQRADFGISDSGWIESLVHARSIVLWGKHVHVSSVHLLPILRQARERGAWIGAIDPMAHRTLRWADESWQPRPGGDLALGLAVARQLCDRDAVPRDIERWTEGWPALRELVHRHTVSQWCAHAGLPPEAARRLAERLLERPATILVGWGLQRRRFGATTVRILDALGALSGNLGIEGGGVSFYVQRRRAFDLSHVRGPEAAPRTVAEARFGHEILGASDPPVRAVWIVCGNPVAMLPDAGTNARALEGRELVVAVDSHPTDTTRRATVVLPCATMLEQQDVVGSYGNGYVGSVRPVVAPPPGVRTDLEIVAALARRWGFGERFPVDARVWKRRLLRAPLTLEQIEAQPVRAPDAPRVLFEGLRFPTPSGRMRLVTALPAGWDRVPDPDYDLWLLSPSHPDSQSSQWSAPRHGVAGVGTVHPETARVRGLAPGDRARLESAVGAMEITVAVDPAQRRDVVIVPKGGSLDEGNCVNVLVAAVETDLGGGAAYQDTRVRLVPLAGEGRRR